MIGRRKTEETKKLYVRSEKYEGDDRCRMTGELPSGPWALRKWKDEK